MTIVTVVRPSAPRPAALRNERDRFVALAFSWADLLFELDSEFRIVFAGGALQPYVGVSQTQLVGASFLDLIAVADRDTVKEQLERARHRERTEDVVVHLSGARGTSSPLAFSGYQLAELDGHYFIAMRSCHGVPQAAVDVDGKRPDPALQTGDAFVASLTRQVGGGSEGAGGCLSLLVLPGYDELRQRLQDAAQLQLLSNVGACMRHYAYAGGMIGRLADNQYGVVHTHPHALDLPRLREDIAAITREVDPLGKGLEVRSTTLAVDNADLTEGDISRAVAYAVNRLEGQGNTDDTADDAPENLPSVSDLARQAVEVAESLRQLIEEDAFDMLLQPVVDTITQLPRHYEALIRFPDNSPLGNLDQHISFAEFTGLIVDLDLAMLRKIINWLRRETGELSRVSVAVNVSGHSVNSMSYLVNLDQILKANPWVRNRLLFELTESARIQDLAGANRFVQKLRQQGSKVCLDDFGAGAANFQYLTHLDVDIVKLDGYAFRDALKASKGKAFLKAFVNLCRELGIATVAEMVETPELYAVAQECGVDMVQGYLFGRPSPDLRAPAPKALQKKPMRR